MFQGCEWLYQLLIAFHWGRAFHCTFKKCWICVISLQRTNQIAWNFLWCFVRFCLAYINGQYAYALWWTADMILGKSPLPKLAKFPVQTFFIGHALRNYSEYSLVYSNNYAVKTWITRKWTETRKKKQVLYKLLAKRESKNVWMITRRWCVDFVLVLLSTAVFETSLL